MITQTEILIGTILSFPLVIFILFLYMKFEEPSRINSLREHFSEYELGGILKGGRLLLWAPSTSGPIVFVGCLLSGIVGVILVVGSKYGGQGLWVIISNIIVFGICLAYYHFYWRPNIGYEVQIVDADGIRTARLSRKGIVILDETKWQEVSDAEVTHSSVGDSDKITGIGLITKNGRILISDYSTNVLLLYHLMSTTYLKRLFFSEASSIHSYLTQVGKPNPQEYLGK